MCNGYKGSGECVVVNWHGGTVNHCHLLTGPSGTYKDLGQFPRSLPNPNETFCVLNGQRGLTRPRPTAAPTATSSPHSRVVFNTLLLCVVGLRPREQARGRGALRQSPTLLPRPAAARAPRARPAAAAAPAVRGRLLVPPRQLLCGPWREADHAVRLSLPAFSRPEPFL